ncbi:uncharacterized protein LOC131882752 [Tigriopus californicus]|uniref:uncharacterized protein LOC131882752 n=1 Tax=Tigriopus californicus TaxID=6832 RepID=UPI0027D9E8DA|nr:uncharacterized protein LOC131882752 [Tigriopus californicus]
MMEVVVGSDFPRSTKGLVILAEGICSVVGGIVNTYSNGSPLAQGLLTVAFWVIASVSLTLTLMYVCNTQTAVEQRKHIFHKFETIYIGVALIFVTITCIITFFGFGVSAIFAYAVWVVLAFDAYRRFRQYRMNSPADVTAETPVPQSF